MSLPDLEAWAIFAKVMELGSFSAAATALGLSNPTVSKAVSRLEDRLGERLIHRNARRFSPTPAARDLARQAARMLALAEAVEAEAAARSDVPHGHVRLAAPMSFGLRHVATALPDFLAACPAVSVDLHLDDRVLDLVGGGFDLALRIADLPDSSLIARRLCSVRRWVVGAPAYFARHGTPVEPSDLDRHACLGYSYLASHDLWRFTAPDGRETAVRVRGPLSVNNADGLEGALLAGLGVALQPDFIAWEAVRDGRLIAVLTDWAAPPLALHLVQPPGEPRAARIRALADFLIRKFSSGAAPWTVDPGGSAGGGAGVGERHS
ncbi:MAG: LysR family transcriptional regulator [Telmatospirillum sp.]|nr:LysR family transcriptional regulator [Telmatospirillum sp.]